MAITIVLVALSNMIDCSSATLYIAPMPHSFLLKEFEELARSAAAPEAIMQRISQRVHLHIPRYNWVGFSASWSIKTILPRWSLAPIRAALLPKQKFPGMKVYAAPPATSKRVVVADNVVEDPRYIQASDLVKSQISVPIQAGARIASIFNIESYFMAAFKPAQEREFVEAGAQEL